MAINFMQNFRKPKGFLGKIILSSMNKGHSALTSWGLSNLNLPKDIHAIDLGCGGGAAIAAMLQAYPQGYVAGIDYSQESVLASRKKNATAIAENRCEIIKASISSLPFSDSEFNLATAFETVYFWPNLLADFKESRRILKPGGLFLLCCEDNDSNNDFWTKKIEGMRVYSEDDLKRYLLEAGFKTIESYRPSSDAKQLKSALCLIAQN